MKHADCEWQTNTLYIVSYEWLIYDIWPCREGSLIVKLLGYGHFFFNSSVVKKIVTLGNLKNQQTSNGMPIENLHQTKLPQIGPQCLKQKNEKTFTDSILLWFGPVQNLLEYKIRKSPNLLDPKKHVLITVSTDSFLCTLQKSQVSFASSDGTKKKNILLSIILVVYDIGILNNGFLIIIPTELGSISSP